MVGGFSGGELLTYIYTHISMRNPSSSSSSSGASNSKTTTTTTPCCSKVGLKRGPWTAEEDQLLSDYIKREGEGRWRTLPKRAGLLRCGKSCRLRWMNYLRPNVKRGHISSDEEDLILRLHRLLGNRWSLIAGRIPGRTDNEIKNYWNTHLSKKLISQGIDPRTHKPLHPTTATDSDSNINNNKSTAVMTSKTTNTIINTNTDDVTQAAPTNPNSSIPSTTTTATVPRASSDMIDNNHADVLPANSTVLEDQINQHQRKDDDNEDDLNTYCTDEVFSSFLNSLINDDMFTQPGQSTDAPVLGYGNDAAAAPSWDPLSAYHHHDSHHDAIIN